MDDIRKQDTHDGEEVQNSFAPTKTTIKYPKLPHPCVHALQYIYSGRIKGVLLKPIQVQRHKEKQTPNHQSLTRNSLAFLPFVFIDVYALLILLMAQHVK